MMIWLFVLWALPVTLLLVIMLGVALHNARHFPRLQPAAATGLPRVSVLIPARNEAANIATIVTQLLAQSTANLELLVLDDNSYDNTAALARAAAGVDSRLRLLHGEALPTGWLGKNWACHQLAQHAQSEWLLFTDADVRWQPHTLTAILAHAQQTEADLLSVWPTQITSTWGEQLIVPLMPFVLHAYLPITLAHDPTKPSAAAANGQCLLFRRTAYEQIGGHATLRTRVLDDVALAHRVKQAGLRLRLVNGNSLLSCRMYTGFVAATNGYTKNILAAHDNRPALLVASTLSHLALFVGPWLWLLITISTQNNWLAWTALLLGLFGIIIRAVTAHIARLRLLDALWMPLSIICMAWIATSALWHHFRHGGPIWKDRRVIIPTRGSYGG